MLVRIQFRAFFLWGRLAAKGTRFANCFATDYVRSPSQVPCDNLSRYVRTERYKLIRYFEPGRTVVYTSDVVPQRVAQHVERPRRKSGQRPVVEFYNLQADPHERNNLAEKPIHTETVRELPDKLWRWMERVGDPLLRGPLRTPYYDEAREDCHDRFRRP